MQPPEFSNATSNREFLSEDRSLSSPAHWSTKLKTLPRELKRHLNISGGQHRVQDQSIHLEDESSSLGHFSDFDLFADSAETASESESPSDLYSNPAGPEECENPKPFNKDQKQSIKSFVRSCGNIEKANVRVSQHQRHKSRRKRRNNATEVAFVPDWCPFNFPIFDPEDVSWETLTYEMIFILLIVYNLIEMPVTLGFDINHDPWNGIGLFNFFVDLFFMADILRRLRTSYYNEKHKLVRDPGKIALNYVRSWWFPVDLICSLPFSHLALIWTDGHRGEGARGYVILRVSRFFRQMRFVQIIRYFRVRHKFDRIGGALAFVASFVFTYVAVHFLACIWMWTAYLEVENGEFSPDSWIARSNWAITDSSGDRSEYYIHALYWAITTVTTVGYGDITPKTPGEQVVCALSMVIGTVGYGYLVGFIVSSVASASEDNKLIKEKLDAITKYCQFRNLSPSLTRRLQDHFLFQYQETTVFDESAILAGVPKRLKQKIILEAYGKIITKTNFLMDFGATCMLELSLNLHPIRLEKGEHVYDQHEIGDEMYIIAQGHVELISKVPDSQRRCRELIGLGNAFGTDGISIEGLARRESTAIIRSDWCQLLCISQEVFRQMHKVYPDIIHRMIIHRNQVLREWRSHLLAESDKKDVTVANVLQVDDLDIIGGLGGEGEEGLDEDPDGEDPLAEAELRDEFNNLLEAQAQEDQELINELSVVHSRSGKRMNLPVPDFPSTIQNEQAARESISVRANMTNLGHAQNIQDTGIIINNEPAPIRLDPIVHIIQEPGQDQKLPENNIDQPFTSTVESRPDLLRQASFGHDLDDPVSAVSRSGRADSILQAAPDEVQTEQHLQVVAVHDIHNLSLFEMESLMEEAKVRKVGKMLDLVCNVVLACMKFRGKLGQNVSVFTSKSVQEKLQSGQYKQEEPQQTEAQFTNKSSAELTGEVILLEEAHAERDLDNKQEKADKLLEIQDGQSDDSCMHMTVSTMETSTDDMKESDAGQNQITATQSVDAASLAPILTNILDAIKKLEQRIGKLENKL